MGKIRNVFTGLTSREAAFTFFFANHVLCQIFSLIILNSLAYFHKQNIFLLNFNNMFDLVSFSLKQSSTNSWAHRK